MYTNINNMFHGLAGTLACIMPKCVSVNVTVDLYNALEQVLLASSLDIVRFAMMY